MSIVRSLLINIGFRVDKRAIANTNQAIIGFKTRFAIAASAATYAFSKITQFFGDIATATLDASELARTLGLSLKELTGLQEAAKEIRINPDILEGLLKRSDQLLEGFINKTSTDLEELARGLKFNIDPTGGSLKVLEQISKALQNVDNDYQKIKIAEANFGTALGTKLVVLSDNYDKFKESASQFAKTLGEQRESALPAMEKYEQALVKLNQSWQIFAMGLSETVFPVLTKLMEAGIGPLGKFFKAVGFGVNFWDAMFSFDKEKIRDSLKEGSKLLDPLFKRTGADKISEFSKNFSLSKGVEPISRYIENRQGYGNGIMTASPIINNTINVPAGTTPYEAQYMSDEIRFELEQALTESFIEIQNNNPTVE